jgi:hypothetical protein
LFLFIASHPENYWLLKTPSTLDDCVMIAGLAQAEF